MVVALYCPALCERLRMQTTVIASIILGASYCVAQDYYTIREACCVSPTGAAFIQEPVPVCPTGLLQIKCCIAIVVEGTNLGISFVEAGNTKGSHGLCLHHDPHETSISQYAVYPADTRFMLWRLSVFVRITQVDWLRGHRRSETYTPAAWLSCQLMWRALLVGLALSISCI